MLRKITSAICLSALTACSAPIGGIEHNASSRSQALNLRNYMPADGVLGQLDFYRNTSPVLDGHSLNVPMAVTRLGAHLLVADHNNNRVLGYAAGQTGVIPDEASLVIGQLDFLSKDFEGIDSNLKLAPRRMATDASDRLYIASDDSGIWRIFVYDNPFIHDSSHEYELLDLPQEVSAIGSIAPDRFVVSGGPSTSDETIHFYATDHLDAPALRQGDVPSPCNGDSGIRGFVRLQNYFTVACATGVYAAIIDETTGFLEPLDSDPTQANWTHVLQGFSDISAIDGVGGIVNGEERDEAFIAEFSTHRVVPVPRPVYYIDTRRDGLQVEPYDVTVHPDFQRYLGHADLSLGAVDPALAGGPNYHPDPEQLGNPSQWGLHSPRDLAWSGDELWVADQNNHRVVRFQTSIANLEEEAEEIFTAQQVIGQVDYTHTHRNRVDGRSIIAPNDVALVSNGQSSHLLTTDSGAHRVVVHTLADRAANGAMADAETLRGQATLFDYASNQGTNNEDGEGFNYPTCIDVDPISNRVAVCDFNNQRIVVYDSYNSGTAPIAIIGRNPEGPLGIRQTFHGLAIHGNFVFAASGDNENDILANRIQIYDLRNLATEDGAPDSIYLPVHVIGQDFDGVSLPVNVCNQNDTTGPDTICDVKNLATDEFGNLWVGDRGNNRILMFQDPTAHLTGADESARLESVIADLVIGQPNMLSNASFAGAGDDAYSRFVEVGDFALTGGEEPGLWAIDAGNSRVLYFPTPHIADPTSGMARATHTLGSNFHPGSGAYRADNRSVNAPSGVAVTPDGKLIFIADRGFSRVLRFTLNDAPILSLSGEDDSLQPAHIKAEEGTSVAVRINAADPEGDNIDLEVVGLNAHLSFDPAPQTLIFDATDLSAGYKAYATIIAKDSSARTNRTELAVSFEVVQIQSPSPTPQVTGTERAPESIGGGGCQSTPISALALVIPFLLIYRRRANEI
ncbi:MAG: hypothetical protein HOK28_22655 [Deltaproteobacteria bacterium]|jgi:DNA-binding beta-propeller fold protein YncE|nr:hypothetical protein [Deltaproteobacteria bacterium]